MCGGGGGGGGGLCAGRCAGLCAGLCAELCVGLSGAARAAAELDERGHALASGVAVPSEPLPCLALPCPALPCPALPCLVLPCPAPAPAPAASSARVCGAGCASEGAACWPTKWGWARPSRCVATDIQLPAQTRCPPDSGTHTGACAGASKHSLNLSQLGAPKPCPQALCIAACFGPEDWPLLIVCPSTMKLVWADAGGWVVGCWVMWRQPKGSWRRGHCMAGGRGTAACCTWLHCPLNHCLLTSRCWPSAVRTWLPPELTPSGRNLALITDGQVGIGGCASLCLMCLMCPLLMCPLA